MRQLWFLLTCALIISQVPAPQLHAQQAFVVGNGTAASCTANTFYTTLQAVKQAGSGRMTFACGTAPHTIVLPQTASIVVNTEIDGAGRITLSGGDTVRIFEVCLPGSNGSADSELKLLGLTLTRGKSDPNRAGAAITNYGCRVSISNSYIVSNTAVFEAGAINNLFDGQLTITKSSLIGNRAATVGGAIATQGGRVSVKDSIFRDNQAQGGGGGAIFGYSGAQVDIAGTSFVTNRTITRGGALFTSGPTTVGNSTFWQNSGALGGHAVVYNGSGTATLTNVTIAGDKGNNVLGTIKLRNSLISNHAGAENCEGQISTEGPNLEYPGISCRASIQWADPLLEELKENGGPTPTVGLAAGSPARDAGDNELCSIASAQNVDQRGVARPQPAGGRCDLGALEFHSATACDPDPAQHLSGQFSSDSQGTISNLSPLCSYSVGIASYRKFGANLSQQIFDWKSATVLPGKSISLQVKLPTCAADVLLFYGPAILSRMEAGQDQRQLAIRAVGGTNYCEPISPICSVFAVDRLTGGNSQLFTLDVRGQMARRVGAVQQGFDITALAMHPKTSALYAVSSKVGVPASLYTLNRQTGKGTLIGSTNMQSIRGLAFRPSDGTLWGWANGGLIRIDTATGAGTLIFSNATPIEAIAWSHDGAVLYAAVNQTLWMYVPYEGSFSQITSNLPGRTDSLEVRPDGLLLGAVNTTNAVDLFAYDPGTLQTITSLRISSSYAADAMTWPMACGNPSAGGEADIITGVTLSKTNPCVGEEIAVSVATQHPESPRGSVDVAINSRMGASQYLQWDQAGKYLVQIIATTPEKHTDTDQRTVEVISCTNLPEYLVVMVNPNPYRQHTIDFQVTNAAGFAGQDPVYKWNFGDGRTSQTHTPYVAHFYGDTLARDQSYSVFTATLTVQRSGKPDLHTNKTVSIWSMYAFNKQNGFIQPPVKTSGQLSLSNGTFQGLYTIHNLEDTPIRFTARQLEYRFCDPQSHSTPQPALGIDLEVGALKQSHQKIFIPQSALSPQICSVALSLRGRSEQGMPVYVSAYFDLPRDLTKGTPVHDPSIQALLDYVVAQNLVSNPWHITEETLYRLSRQGKITFPLPATATRSITPTAVRTVTPADGPVGQPCVQNDPYPRIGLECVPTGPPIQFDGRIANAYKGDIILSPGCGNGMISNLLRQTIPPQRFSHNGMMVEDFSTIRHSTSAEGRYESHKIIEGLFGLQTDPLRYGWPGAITQSVKDAYNSDYLMHNPEDDEDYNLTGFSNDAKRCGTDVNLTQPTVVKPPPGSDPAVRERLHAVADLAKTIQGHYRFFAYTNGAIANDTAYNAPADYNWDGIHPTIASVCSTFVWHALKMAGVSHLEGDHLEIEDIRRGAWRDDATLDGLYFYSQAERKAAAYQLYNDVYDKGAKSVIKAAIIAAIAPIYGFPFPIAVENARTTIANQVTNCFGFDKCAEGSEELWQQPGVGRTVSPENILFWDSPAQGGVYGYNEPVNYRGLEYFRQGTWQPQAELGGISGRVLNQGQPFQGAAVRITWLEAQGAPNFIEMVSDANGTFLDTLLPPGHYDISISATDSNGVKMTARKDVTITKDAIASIELALEPLPQYFREVIIQGSMFILDDENWPDENEYGTFPFEVRVKLDANNRSVQVPEIRFCAGKEVSGHLSLNVTLEPDNTSVHVTGSSWLLEGGSLIGSACYNDDEKEDTAAIDVKLAADAAHQYDIHLESDGGDEVDIELMIINDRQQ